MTTTKRRKKTNGVLRAEIKEEICVNASGPSEVCLEITSENQTQRTILLDKNYYIPLNEPFDIEAYDLNNRVALDAFYNRRRKRIEVVFKKGTRLPRHHKFSFRLRFKTTRFGSSASNEPGSMIGFFSLTPGQFYKSIAIVNHRVQLSFVFWRPKEGEALRDVEVSEKNSLGIPAKPDKQLPDRVVYTFETFDLSKGSELKITFNYKYRSSAPVSLEPAKKSFPLIRHLKPVCSAVWQVVPAIVATVLKDIILLLFRKGGSS